MAAMSPAEQRELLRRVALWPMTAEPTRVLVLVLAGLSPDRANDDLSTFSTKELHLLACVVSTLEADLMGIRFCVSQVQTRSRAVVH
jgi:hypothetical protein